MYDIYQYYIGFLAIKKKMKYLLLNACFLAGRHSDLYTVPPVLKEISDCVFRVILLYKQLCVCVCCRTEISSL